MTRSFVTVLLPPPPPPRLWLLLLLLLALTTITTIHGLEPQALQISSTANNNIYGGAMAVQSGNSLVVGGQIYSSSSTLESDCAWWQLSTTGIGGILQISQSQTAVGAAGATEACRSIAATTLDDNNNNNDANVVQAAATFLGGFSVGEGALQSLHTSGSNRPAQYGTILELSDANDDGDVALVGGALVSYTTGAQTAQAMVLSQDESYLYVALWESDVAEENQGSASASATENCRNDQCNYATADSGVPRGKHYKIRVVRYLRGDLRAAGPTARSGTLATTLTATWQRNLATQFEMKPTGLVLLKDDGQTLLLVGHGVGANDAFPATTSPTSDRNQGFVTKIDAKDGRILPGALRVETPTGEETIEGVCVSQSYAYVVGTTTGSFNGDGENPSQVERMFLLKLELSDLRLEASIELEAMPGSNGGGTPAVRGWRCVLSQDESEIFVAANVYNGAHVEGHPNSNGKTDIVLAKYMTPTLEREWIRQVGTKQDDTVVDLVLHQNHPVVLANTLGSYGRNRAAGETGSELLILTFDPITGNYATPAEQDTSSIAEPVTEPPEIVGPDDIDPTGDDIDETPAETIEETFDDNEVDMTLNPPNNSIPSDNNASNRNRGLLVVLALAVAMCFILLFVYQKRRRYQNSKDLYPDSSGVLEYLKGFENVEVDLKHSATGGWHGTYVNHDGAPKFMDMGRNSFSTTAHSTTRRSTTSVAADEISFDTEMEPFVQNSLFADDDDDDRQLGGSGGHGSVESGALERASRSSSTYGGLVDAYNTTWDDLSPHTLPPVESRRRPQTTLTEVDFNDSKNGTMDYLGAWGKEIV